MKCDCEGWKRACEKGWVLIVDCKEVEPTHCPWCGKALRVEIEPCPFCGDDNMRHSHGLDDKLYMYCPTCGATGPTAAAGFEVAAWNRRDRGEA